jgi:hypothetical protein
MPQAPRPDAAVPPDAGGRPDAADPGPLLELPELAFPLSDPSELGPNPRLGIVTSRRRLLIVPASGARQRDFDRALAEAGPRKRGSLAS